MAANRSLVRTLISVQKLLHCPAIPPSQSTIIGGNNGVRRFSTEITESATKVQGLDRACMVNGNHVAHLFSDVTELATRSKEDEQKEIWALNWALAADMSKNTRNEIINAKSMRNCEKIFVQGLKRLQKAKHDTKALALVAEMQKDVQNAIEQESEKWAQVSMSWASVPNLLKEIPEAIENLESRKGCCDEHHELQKMIEAKIKRIQQKFEHVKVEWLHLSKVWEHFSIGLEALLKGNLEESSKGLHSDLRKLVAKSKKYKQEKEKWAVEFALMAEMSKNIQNEIEQTCATIEHKLGKITESCLIMIESFRSSDNKQSMKISALVAQMSKVVENEIEQEEKWAQVSKRWASAPNLLKEIPEEIKKYYLESSEGCNDELRKIEAKIRIFQQKIEIRKEMWLHFSKAWENIPVALMLPSLMEMAKDQKSCAQNENFLLSKGLSGDLHQLAINLEELVKAME